LPFSLAIITVLPLIQCILERGCLSERGCSDIVLFPIFIFLLCRIARRLTVPVDRKMDISYTSLFFISHKPSRPDGLTLFSTGTRCLLRAVLDFEPSGIVVQRISIGGTAGLLRRSVAYRQSAANVESRPSQLVRQRPSLYIATAAKV